MKISYNWLQTYFDKKLPTPNKLAELFTFHSFEVEGIEKAIDDTLLDIKVLPDRAHYALSHRGIALETALVTGLTIKDEYENELPVTASDKPKIVIENNKFCRRYIGRYVEVKNDGESPKWLTERLISIGQRSISPIVDATNYVMFDIGQPLHAFDADKIKGRLVIRSAEEGESMELLPERVMENGQEVFKDRIVKLTTDDFVIADDEGPLVIAGVKGGRRAEVSSDTKRVIIESANFDPRSVRRTSTKYDLRSDSSKRFENEITPELAIRGMNDVCAILKEIDPRAKFGPIVDEYPVKVRKTVITFDPKMIESRLGLKVPEKEAKEILKNMGMEVLDDIPSSSRKILGRHSDQGGDRQWNIGIPSERLDLNIPEDLVEEIGRIYGYDRIKGILPENKKAKVTVLPVFYVSEKIKNIMVEHGFSEVSLYSLVKKGEIEAAKPLAKDKAFARTNLGEGMFECVKKNSQNADLLGLEAVKVFEIGHVFTKNSEHINLVIGAEQVKKIKGVKGDTIIKDILARIESEMKDHSKADLSTAKIETRGNVSICEINLDKVVKSLGGISDSASYNDLSFRAASTKKFEKFSPYPFIVRDIALFVIGSGDEQSVWGEISKGIEDVGAQGILARHSLFDVFKKGDKTSYAFRLVFQSKERTLTDAEVNGVMQSIYARVKSKGWEVR